MELGKALIKIEATEDSVSCKVEGGRHDLTMLLCHAIDSSDDLLDIVRTSLMTVLMARLSDDSSTPEDELEEEFEQRNAFTSFNNVIGEA